MKRWPCIFLLSLLFSCTERIDIQLKDQYKRLVVEGHIGIDTTTYTVILSETLNYFETNTTTPYVSNASVSITELETGKTFLLEEHPSLKGHYQTDPNAFGIQGYTYRLDIAGVDIDKDGQDENYTATSFFPYIADRIDSIKAIHGRYMLGDIMGGGAIFDSMQGWNILLYAKDPPTQEYYVFVSYKNGVAVNDTFNRFLRLEDAIIGQTGIGINGLPIEFLPDKSWKKAVIGDTLALEIRSVSQDYYRYLGDLDNVYGGNMPLFGGAPANVRGNVSGGAIGYFAAFGNRKASVVLRNNFPFAEKNKP